MKMLGPINRYTLTAPKPFLITLEKEHYRHSYRHSSVLRSTFFVCTHTHMFTSHVNELDMIVLSIWTSSFVTDSIVILVSNRCQWPNKMCWWQVLRERWNSRTRPESWLQGHILQIEGLVLGPSQNTDVLVQSKLAKEHETRIKWPLKRWGRLKCVKTHKPLHTSGS